MEYEKSFIAACKKLGNYIQEYRIKKQLTIKELSVKSGIRKEYLKKIESGKAYGVLLEKLLLKIANCLNLSEKVSHVV